jgi:hypothetical protein
MTAKRISKYARKWIASALKKGQGRNPMYVQKHYDVLGYLYENDQTEIKTIVESVNKVVKNKN